MKGAAILFRAGDELKAAVNAAAGQARITQDAFMRAAVEAMVERVRRTGRIDADDVRSAEAPEGCLTGGDRR